MPRTTSPPDWAGKYVGAIARIAGLLHLGDHITGRWGQPIEASTIERAIAIGDYYTAHAVAAFDLMWTEPAVDDARAVLDWLARSGRTQFKAKDIVAASRRFKTVDSVGPALTLLEQHGYVRALQTERGGSRGQEPAVTYRFIPHRVLGWRKRHELRFRVAGVDQELIQYSDSVGMDP